MKYYNVSRLRIRYAALLAAIAVFCCTAQAAELPEKLTPLGIPAGIRSGMDGVTVAGVIGDDSPASQAGITAGDVILALDGKPIRTAGDLAEDLSPEVPVKLTLRRENSTFDVTLTPASVDGSCRIGVWLRDSLLGIGTLTYYDPQSGCYGALGHGISEQSKDTLISLGEGSVIPAEVTDLCRGAAGKPGELHGKFHPEAPCGTCVSNTNGGVFGVLYESPVGDPIPVAHVEDIHAGDAEILACVEGGTPKCYGIRILKACCDERNFRDLLIQVTDAELIEAAGGIVQGMSGSPIIQDGKLIGAVTHVMVNDPTRGYGISIENMLKAAG